jgi:hypothetical protein
MVFNRNAANFRQPLIDLQVTAIRRQAGQTDRALS